MTLGDFLEAKGLSQADFAARLSERMEQPVPAQSMSRWARRPGTPGYGIPSPEIIAAIHRETRGEVTAASWYAHVLPVQRRAAS